MTEQAARFTGSIPEHYDRQLGPLIFTDFASDLVGRVAQYNPGSVLELAAGTGIVSRKLRDVMPAGTCLLATDLNPPMLKQARRKFGAEEDVRLEPADATHLTYADASFDTVVCQFGLMFFPDRDRSHREVLRVLRPGGRYLFNVWDSWDHNPFAQIAHECQAAFFPQDPPGFYRVPFSCSDTDLLREALFTAGFSDVAVEPVEVRAQIPSVSDFATGLVFGNPSVDEISQRGGDPQAVCEALAIALQEKLGDSMPLRAIVIEARKGAVGH